MKAKIKVVYVPPVYEEVQHEVTSVDDKNNPLRISFHTDVSLLQRIDTMRADAQTIREIKESLQPMIDTSNFRSQFEETFGSLTDDELINSCPSRYTQTASEKMSYLRELAAKANDMRAAGLNALLGDVSASGNVGSGATASAAESAQTLPTDYSFVGDAAIS